MAKNFVTILFRFHHRSKRSKFYSSILRRSIFFPPHALKMNRLFFIIITIIATSWPIPIKSSFHKIVSRHGRKLKKRYSIILRRRWKTRSRSTERLSVIRTDILNGDINSGRGRTKKRGGKGKEKRNYRQKSIVNSKSREIFRGRNPYFIDSGLRKYPATEAGE